MLSNDTMELLRELFEEYKEWYFSVAEEDGVLPRSISVIDADGKQFIYLLDDTVRRNVALGVHDGVIDDARVWTVLRQARLEEVVRRLPQGLDTYVGERGMRLSGGERQRLGIARAL